MEAGNPTDAGQRPAQVGRALRARPAWMIAVAAVVFVGVFGWMIALWRFGSVSPTEVAARRSAPPTSEKSAAQPPPDFAAAKSVAVLAFANLSDVKANEYFSDGIS